MEVSGVEQNAEERKEKEERERTSVPY